MAYSQDIQELTAGLFGARPEAEPILGLGQEISGLKEDIEAIQSKAQAEVASRQAQIEGNEKILSKYTEYERFRSGTRSRVGELLYGETPNPMEALAFLEEYGKGLEELSSKEENPSLKAYLTALQKEVATYVGGLVRPELEASGAKAAYGYHKAIEIEKAARENQERLAPLKATLEESLAIAENLVNKYK